MLVKWVNNVKAVDISLDSHTLPVLFQILECQQAPVIPDVPVTQLILHVPVLYLTALGLMVPRSLNQLYLGSAIVPQILFSVTVELNQGYRIISILLILMSQLYQTLFLIQ
jgi:hypothetical protein